MSRTRRHIVSRSLIGLLGVTIILGLVFYFHNVSNTRAKEEPRALAGAGPATRPAAAPVAVAAAVPAPPRPAVPQPMVTVTPSASVPRPTSQPAAQGSAATPASPVISKNPLADAQAKQDAGDLLGARRILNDALWGGRPSDADSDALKKAISEINQTVVFSPQRFADDEFGGTYSVQSGDLLKKIADRYEVTWELLMRLNGMSDPRRLRAGQTIKVVKGPFNVVVWKGRFNMDVYLGPPGEKGSLYVTSFPVGLGRDDSTPTGTWLVETHKKIKNPTYFSPRGEGVIDADDPKNPLGERWIGLTGIDGHAIGKSSYGIHGTIDETSVGKQESMGCIRMKNADVEWVFDLLVEGKSVVVVRE